MEKMKIEIQSLKTMNLKVKTIYTMDKNLVEEIDKVLITQLRLNGRSYTTEYKVLP